MEKKRLVFEVQLPGRDEVKDAFPHYGTLIDGPLLDVIMTPESFVACSMATEIGLPAVAGIASKCRQNVGGRLLEPWEKQFIGRAVCFLMEANGYKKTGKKRAVGREGFTRAELYVRA